MTQTIAAIARLGDFAVAAPIPTEARTRAARAVLDTAGVALAGAVEPASRVVRDAIGADAGGACAVLGTCVRSSAANAALANGTSAHALDFDDMCFVSLAHPSAPLVPAAFAAAELAHASGRALLDAYVAGFEIEGRLGRLMNPRHYERGWHCTSTLGTIGAAAAASRLLGLDAAAAGHALAIAASEASGLKENFGTMVKPLHAGLAARNGVLAALLARGGMTASLQAFDGPQGFLRAMDSERQGLAGVVADLGSRWEIIDTGITVKLYPSCAGTHPALDAILDLRRAHGFAAEEVDHIEVDVDAITPTILIYPRPVSGLEGKFSLPFCAAAAVVFGHVGVDTFDDTALADPRVVSMMARVSMRVDPALEGIGPPLTEARVRISLKDGRLVRHDAHGARGYPERPPSDAELRAKFTACARRVLSEEESVSALGLLQRIDAIEDVRQLTDALITREERVPASRS